jgi:hypothetical protein
MSPSAGLAGLTEFSCLWSRIMRSPQRSTRLSGWVAALVVLMLAASPQTARAQFPGFGWGYGGMGYGGMGYGGMGYGGMGYGGMGYGGMGYGGMGYGGMGFGYGMYGSPFGFGYPGVGFGIGGLGYGYGVPGGFGYWAPALAYGNFNPLFGVGLTPLAVESYNIETNVLGRGQYRRIPGSGAPVFRQVR